MGETSCFFFLVCSCCSGILIIGSVFFLTVNFLIFEPYFDLEGEEAECLITSVSAYNFFGKEDKDDNRIYMAYSLIEVLVNIEGHGIQGFSCGCSESTATYLQTLNNGQYAWQYSPCEVYNECENMLLQPAGYCDGCRKCTEFLTQEKVKCLGMFKAGNTDLKHPREFPVGYKIKFPTFDSAFIQISLKEKAYYPEIDYLVFNIIVLGIFIILPGVCVFCSSIGLLIALLLHK